MPPEILTRLANTLCEEGEIDERESFIDATFGSAKGAAMRLARPDAGKA